MFKTVCLNIKQSPTTVHILESSLSLQFLRDVSSALSYCDQNLNLVIDDPNLSDQGADEITNALPNNISSSLMLVLSKSKIQGVIKTYSLSTDLSNLELHYFIQRIRTLCSGCVPDVSSWNESLQWHDYERDGIIETFINVLLSYRKTSKCKLKIGQIENHTLIAHALNFKRNN